MTDKEQEELNEYLQDEYNYETYKEFLYTDYKGLFEPLEYFRLFYHQLDFANFSAFEKDMQIVRNQFEILGLTEVTKMIDNDLADQEKRTEKNLY